MFNFARQGFANPFASAVGASLQPGIGTSVGRCPACGNLTTVAGALSTVQPQTLGMHSPGVGQQTFGISPTVGFGLINPLTPNINPLAQFGTPWAAPTHFANQGVGRFGAADPNFAPVIGDPISLLMSQQQLNPVVNSLVQQQLPIRPLIGGQQAIGAPQLVPGFASGVNQWAEPYRAFIEAQLISQLATNPLYQLARGYTGIPEATGLGAPLAGQPFNPFVSNVPFYG